MVGVESLFGPVALALLCAVYLGPWQWGWADYGRQVVFEERDAIFDMARMGELEFGSDAYETVRARLNCLIRFAHRATVFRLLFHFVMRRPSDSEVRQIETTIMQIDDEAVRAKVKERVQRAEMTLVACIMARSIVSFWLLVAFFMIRAICRRIMGGHVGSFADALAKAGSVVQAEATVICA